MFRVQKKMRSADFAPFFFFGSSLLFTLFVSDDRARRSASMLFTLDSSMITGKKIGIGGEGGRYPYTGTRQKMTCTWMETSN